MVFNDCSQTTVIFMLSVEKCKTILGTRAASLSDEAVEFVRDQLYILANLCFDHWSKTQMNKNEHKQYENHENQNL